MAVDLHQLDGGGVHESQSMFDLLQAAGNNLILKSLPEAMVVVFDPDLRFVSTAGRGLAAVELSAGVITGRTIFETFPPDVVAVIEPLYRAALAGKESSFDLEYNGRTYLQRVAPVHDADGTIVAGVGLGQDVTAARQARLELIEERRRLREAQEIGRLGSWELDIASGRVTWSDMMFELYGVEPTEEVTYAATLQHVHPEDRLHVDRAVNECINDGVPLRIRYRAVRPNDGAVRWVDARGQRITGEPGPARLVGAVADVTDVTAQVIAEGEARARHAFQEAVITASPDIIFVYDVVSRRTMWSNRSLSKLLGYDGVIDASNAIGPRASTDADQTDCSLESELVAAFGSEFGFGVPGTRDIFEDLMPEEDRSPFEAALLDARAAADNETVQLNHRLYHADGSVRWFSRRTTPLRRDGSGQVTQLVGALRDITDAVALERQLTHSALHDDLTGLPNRALLVDRLDSALARTRRDGREIAVLFCDLDGFKRVNDTAGHAAGDAVLVETAKRLQGVLREGDTIARVGGDEFVILIEPWNRVTTHEIPLDPAQLVRLDRALAPLVANRIAEALRQPIMVRDIEHVVTASIGITYASLPAAGPARSMTADEVLQDADAAMYQAKRWGKDRFEVFEHVMSTDLAERGRVEQLLRQAIRGHSLPATDPPPGPFGRRLPTLSAAYQPVFDSQRGKLVGFEALARLTDADGVSIPPSVFIGVAEDTGLIRSLGLTMLDIACGQLASWRSELPDLDDVTMAVNISAHHAQHPNLGSDVRQALLTHTLEPSALVLELTETALLEAANSTIRALRGLFDDGVGIAIDDFGTGYASLRYLATLPVSAVKIDQSFTAGLMDNANSRKIVNAVAGLAADMDLTCVVEGVETKAQQLALPLGVQVQGWLTGKPLQPEELDLPVLLAGVAV
jgi:diguanylate cyclase (GGDEF)-like protein/PAS domain S-box-containing protein